MSNAQQLNTHSPAPANVQGCSPSSAARDARAEPEVLKGAAVPPLKWGAADEDGLVKFLVEEKSFSEERIRKVLEKMNAKRSKANQGGKRPRCQSACACNIKGSGEPLKAGACGAGRLETFFGPVTVKSSTAGGKRKEPPKPAKGAKGRGATAKKGKAGGAGSGGKKK